MHRAYDRIIQRLAAYGSVMRPLGKDRVMAQCPAHHDRTPSLKVSAGDGKALVKCFAGCATPDVMAALGMSMRDLFDDGAGA